MAKGTITFCFNTETPKHTKKWLTPTPKLIASSVFMISIPVALLIEGIVTHPTPENGDLSCFWAGFLATVSPFAILAPAARLHRAGHVHATLHRRSTTFDHSASVRLLGLLLCAAGTAAIWSLLLSPSVPIILILLTGLPGAALTILFLLSVSNPPHTTFSPTDIKANTGLRKTIKLDWADCPAPSLAANGTVILATSFSEILPS